MSEGGSADSRVVDGIGAKRKKGETSAAKKLCEICLDEVSERSNASQFYGMRKCACSLRQKVTCPHPVVCKKHQDQFREIVAKERQGSFFRAEWKAFMSRALAAGMRKELIREDFYGRGKTGRKVPGSNQQQQLQQLANESSIDVPDPSTRSPKSSTASEDEDSHRDRGATGGGAETEGILRAVQVKGGQLTHYLLGDPHSSSIAQQDDAHSSAGSAYSGNAADSRTIQLLPVKGSLQPQLFELPRSAAVVGVSKGCEGVLATTACSPFVAPPSALSSLPPILLAPSSMPRYVQAAPSQIGQQVLLAPPVGASRINRIAPGYVRVMPSMYAHQMGYNQPMAASLAYGQAPPPQYLFSMPSYVNLHNMLFQPFQGSTVLYPSTQAAAPAATPASALASASLPASAPTHYLPHTL